MTPSIPASPAPDPTAVRPGVLAGKRILVTGVLTPKSIAYAIAEACQAQGAELLLTSFGRAMSLTQRSAQRLASRPDVVEMDVTKPEQVAAVAAEVAQRWGSLDGVVHAVGFAPDDCLGGGFLDAPWESVAIAFHVSSYSMKTLAQAFAPLMAATEGRPGGGAMVALTLDAEVAWPRYDWMGPAKAALESIVRYLGRDLGPQNIRVNSIAAGPLDTVAAKSIPGFDELKTQWASQAPLGWNPSDSGPVADTSVFLLSEMARAITGSVVYVDGGYHSLGAPNVLAGKENG